MKVVVVGGTGLIGAKIVEQFTRTGHEVVVAARSTGVDVAKGIGLADALLGAEVVVDVSNSGYSEASEMQLFFEQAGTNLFGAERNASVRHHVALSAASVGELNSGYFAAKKVQEDIVVDSGIPFTIVRSTPFFEYLYNVVGQGGEGDTLRLPDILIQPVAGDDVARALVHAALTPPANGIIEVAGPETFTLPALAEEILAANEDCRTVIADPDAAYFGAHIGNASLVGGDHPRFGPTRFEDWLRRSLIPA